MYRLFSFCCFCLFLFSRDVFAFQSQSLDCGFKYIVPPLIVAIISGIVALLRSGFIIFSDSEKKGIKLIKWWLLPCLALGMGVIFSYIC